MVDWSKVEFFIEDEFRCNCGKCGGRADVTPALVFGLDELRRRLGYGLIVNEGGGFRCPLHPDEAKKEQPGAHAQGRAADIKTIGGQKKHELKKEAYALGFLGIGDGKTFTHLDVGHDAATRPANWQY